MKKKICIVVSNYYPKISNDLINGVLKSFKKHGIKSYKKIFAPGVFEIPVLIVKNINKFDGFIVLGCIIRGETYHFELIANEVSRKIMDLSISSNKPIGFGILTCENMEQAHARSDVLKKDKGGEAAKACYEILLNG